MYSKHDNVLMMTNDINNVLISSVKSLVRHRINGINILQ